MKETDNKLKNIPNYHIIVDCLKKQEVSENVLINLLNDFLYLNNTVYNADHLWDKANKFTYALQINGYLTCLEDLQKLGVIELKNIDKNY